MYDEVTVYTLSLPSFLVLVWMYRFAPVTEKDVMALSSVYTYSLSSLRHDASAKTAMNSMAKAANLFFILPKLIVFSCKFNQKSSISALFHIIIMQFID